MMEDRYLSWLRSADFENVAAELHRRWRTEAYDSFAELYTDAVAIWDGGQCVADGVYLFGHDFERYENNYVIVQPASTSLSIVVDPHPPTRGAYYAPPSMHGVPIYVADLDGDTRALVYAVLMQALALVYECRAKREEVIPEE